MARTSLIALLLTAPILSGIPAATVQAAESVTLVTRDGVQLGVTYFPSVVRKGTPEAKQVTPVLLLHDYKETRAIYNSLAQRLAAVGGQERKGPGFAALTVDLRAHGESTKQAFRDGSQGDLDAARLNKASYQAMAVYDMEAVRSFLLEKNDAGELNLNKLCIVGAGMGASVAVNWALQDWAAPALAIGKQGQDVKALVLISPEWSYNGLSFQRPMKFRPLKQNVAWMLIYGGQDGQQKNEVVRIEKQLERFHSDETKGGGQHANSLQVMPWPASNLKGGTLLTQIGQPIEDRIVAFLLEQVGTKHHPWSSRLDRVPR